MANFTPFVNLCLFVCLAYAAICIDRVVQTYHRGDPNNVYPDMAFRFCYSSDLDLDSKNVKTNNKLSLFLNNFKNISILVNLFKNFLKTNIRRTKHTEKSSSFNVSDFLWLFRGNFSVKTNARIRIRIRNRIGNTVIKYLQKIHKTGISIK